MRVSLRLYVIIVKKSYHVDSKSCGTSNLLAHITNCPENPNREDIGKGHKTLAFEPKNDEDEGFQLVSTTFTIEASRNALAKMIIIDELSFRCFEGYGFKKYVTTLQPKLHLKDISSCQIVPRDVIGIYNSEREKLRKSLKDCRVSYYGHMEFYLKFELYVSHMSLY